MARTYQQIQDKIAELKAEADEIRRKEVDEVVGRIKDAISHYGLTAEDLGFTSKGRGGRKAATKQRAGKSQAPNGDAAPSQGVKYRDEAGNTWGGRGPRPRWLRNALAAGKTLQDFAV